MDLSDCIEACTDCAITCRQAAIHCLSNTRRGITFVCYGIVAISVRPAPLL